jgi:hypothetical protein
VIAGGAIAAALGISAWAFVTRPARRPQAETAS